MTKRSVLHERRYSVAGLAWCGVQGQSEHFARVGQEPTCKRCVKCRLPEVLDHKARLDVGTELLKECRDALGMAHAEAVAGDAEFTVLALAQDLMDRIEAFVAAGARG